MQDDRSLWRPLDFADVAGWAADDLAGAWIAYRHSLAYLADRIGVPDEARRAAQRMSSLPSADEVRRHFETHFEPWVLQRPATEETRGLLTGYYEPELEGSLVPSKEFSVPLYRRPPDLENVVAESDRAGASDGFSHLRRTPDGLMPYFTREEIDRGALADRGLELLWLADWVDAFVLHVQGSGRVRLPDGRNIGLSYDGKNGHPYTSIGRILIDAGALPAEGLTMDRLTDWLRADPERGRRTLWHNRSFVFFRERPQPDQGPVGVGETPLTPGRSLAVDPAHHRLGLPVFVSAPEVEIDSQPLRRLMFAHDVGSAIRGPERGDFFFGTGQAAAARAGATKARCTFVRLLPRRAS